MVHNGPDVRRTTASFPAFSPACKVAVLAAALLAATAMMLALDRARFFRGDRETVRQFQRMAGGIGLGATVRPRWCFVNFDPRLEHCTCAEQPLPGGYCYCPDHAGTVSFFDARAVGGVHTRTRQTPRP